MLSINEMGSPEDFSNFVTAVIHEVHLFYRSSKKDTDAEIIVGELR
jgi:1-pyrroline-5-carboxylate dehydrogenase